MPAAKPKVSRRDIAGADGGVAVGRVAAAISRAPRGPALIETPAWAVPWSGSRHKRARCQAAGSPPARAQSQCSAATEAAAAETAEPSIDERIEHQAQKLGHQLKGTALCAGCDLAVQLRERIAQDCRRSARTRCTKFGGSAPPELKKLFSPFATVLLVAD